MGKKEGIEEMRDFSFLCSKLIIIWVGFITVVWSGNSLIMWAECRKFHDNHYTCDEFNSGITYKEAIFWPYYMTKNKQKLKEDSQ